MNNNFDVFLSNLAEIHDAESRIAKALSKMNQPDAPADLKTEILTLINDTEGNISGVENLRYHLCGRDYPEPAIEAHEPHIQNWMLIASLMANQEPDSPPHGGERVWEIASYGCLCEWDILTHRIEAANFLEAILEEEINQAPASDDWI